MWCVGGGGGGGADQDLIHNDKALKTAVVNGQTCNETTAESEHRDGLRQQLSPVTGVAGPVPVFRATTSPSYPVHVLVALGGVLSKVDTYTHK